ncbi:putative 5-3 exonuclease [Sesbania bispinosa]|nr:putative 5-3 exonuclease [Sesbania bispinosa]
MGVPAFYRWLVNKYPKVVEDVNATTMANPNDGVGYDNLYLDMNSIIHPCFHPEEDPNSPPPPTTFDEVFTNIFNYIDGLVSIVRPRKLLYMAIDGVAPRAKMNQQRSRRFRTAKDEEMREAEEDRLRKQFELEGKQVLPKQESQVSDSNTITPGTEFMYELSKALKTYISSRIASDSLWRDFMVILSDANVPGEGEHKDADLIMLGMATHEPHFSILREKINYSHSGHVQDALIQEQKQQIAARPFKFLHIWLLREYLEIDMKIQDPPKNCSIDFERIIDDFVFMCFFAGNDFLPHMPSLEIHEGAIDLLMTVYKKQFNKLGGYLVDITRVGEKHAAFVMLSRIEKFILMVGTYEEKIFNKRSDIRDRKLRRIISDFEHSKQEEQDAVRCSDFDNESSSHCSLLIKKAPASQGSAAENTKELKEELKKCIREKGDLFKSGEFLIDKIKLGTAGYKERYYKEKFSVEGSTDIECKRKDIVQKYTEGLLWVLQYYFSGVPSWTWFYPYHYGPFASDLRGMAQIRVNFEKGTPFLPFDQLLSVLPPRSAYALPEAYAELMLDEQSRIYEWYPQDFEVDIEGKRFMWQENEKIRNSIKVDSLFFRSTSKLGEKICSLSQESNVNPSFMLHTSISDGIGGTISLYDECVEKPCLGIETCDNKQEDHVICVYYELPAGDSSHIPHLLSGVEFPDKTIFDNDIMETVLWHESQRHGRFDRVPIQDKWRSTNSGIKFSPNANTQHRSFSLNTPTVTVPEVTYKGAGVGWGSSGRGKPGNSPNMKRNDTMSNDKMTSFSLSHKQFKDAGSYSYHQVSQSETIMPFGRGRGRLQPNFNNVNSWRGVSSSNSSLRPQWSGAKEYKVKDRNRW